tara:strand:+ start:405 stop:1028 length:624 start_codon:yes stop_codon:yes gene_type:complete
MNLQLLSAIKNRPKKSEECKVKLPQTTNTEIITSFPRKKEITIIKKSETKLKQIRNSTKELARIEPVYCSLEEKKYKLKKLVNENNIYKVKDKKYIRMFHGTNTRHLTDILVHGLRLVGGGALGNGFYMTPSLVKAEQYNIKQQQKDMNISPIVLELFLPIKTTVSAYPEIHTDVDLYTEKGEFWQFVTKNENFLKKSIRFNIFIYQ